MLNRIFGILAVLNMVCYFINDPFATMSQVNLFLAGFCIGGLLYMGDD